MRVLICFLILFFMVLSRESWGAEAAYLNATAWIAPKIKFESMELGGEKVGNREEGYSALPGVSLEFTDFNNWETTFFSFELNAFGKAKNTTNSGINIAPMSALLNFGYHAYSGKTTRRFFFGGGLLSLNYKNPLYDIKSSDALGLTYQVGISISREMLNFSLAWRGATGKIKGKVKETGAEMKADYSFSGAMLKFGLWF